MDEVVAPVLHNREHPGADVVSLDVPLQLFTTVITGVAGTAFGAATAVATALVQPFTVVVSV